MNMENVRTPSEIRRKPPPSRRKPPVKKPPVVARTRVKERLAKFDIPFFVITLVLMVFGIGMLLSASYAFAAREHNDSFFFFNRQLAFMGIGLVLMLAASVVPYHIYRNPKIVAILIVASVLMMLIVNLGFGVSQGGSSRWLGKEGIITFQPSEILKLALIIVMAYVVHLRHERLKSGKGFILVVAIAGIACGLMAWQKHLSGTIIMFAIAAVLVFVSPIRKRYIIGSVLLLSVLAGIAFASIPLIDQISDANVEGRIESWRNPESDIQGETFQTYQSLITIGSGGWFGLGLGNSRQKFSYLPATHNDFIFSVVCEELGFVGGALVLLLFAILIMRGFYIAAHARDRFAMMVAVGITAQIGVQALLNIAVVTNSVPNTGITLPFFSYGGTAMVMMMAQIGILLNISRKTSIE